MIPALCCCSDRECASDPWALDKAVPYYKIVMENFSDEDHKQLQEDDNYQSDHILSLYWVQETVVIRTT